MRGLKGKVILVAGGATGIGAATAARLHEEGARLMIGDRNEAALNETAARLTAKGGEVTAQVFDMADEGSIKELVAACVARYGGIDGLVVTVADLSLETLGRDAPLEAMDAAIWERTLKVNLVGHAILFREVLPCLRRSGGGAIATTSSGSACMGMPEMPAYAASKAGLQALVRHTAAIGGADNIRCNAIAPGIVLTEGGKVNMTDEMVEHAQAIQFLPRIGEPSDIASVFAFLVSDDAAWITGQTISVNAGAALRD